MADVSTKQNVFSAQHTYSFESNNLDDPTSSEIDMTPAKELTENSDSDPGHGSNNLPNQHQLKKEKNRKLIEKIIQEAKDSGATSIDLSGKGMKAVPDSMLELSKVQYVYLAGNLLKCLPDNFFNCLPNISWLDLRRNLLIHLPSSYIGSHCCLQNLLLEGNHLRTLPLEIGLIPTLSGLNLSDNPLEFPPKEILSKGTVAILHFFRNCLRCKSQGQRIPQVGDLLLDGGFDSDVQSTSSEEGYHHSKSTFHSSSHRLSHAESQSSRASMGEYADLIPSTHSAGLHRQVSYNEMKQAQQDRLRRAGALGPVQMAIEERRNNGAVATNTTSATSGSRKNQKLKKLSQYPEPPPAERINERYIEERRNEQMRVRHEKEDDVIQKRKDDKMLKDWQYDAKKSQQERYRESYIHGGAKEKIDVAKDAPFAVEEEHMKVQTNEERIANDVKKKHEKMRRAMSPETIQKIERARLIRDKELENKIKIHTLSMKNRRDNHRGTTQEEMLAAKRELEVAEQLQKDIEQRRKAMEYRFQAFTGE